VQSREKKKAKTGGAESVTQTAKKEMEGKEGKTFVKSGSYWGGRGGKTGGRGGADYPVSYFLNETRMSPEKKKKKGRIVKMLHGGEGFNSQGSSRKGGTSSRFEC